MLACPGAGCGPCGVQKVAKNSKMKLRPKHSTACRFEAIGGIFCSKKKLNAQKSEKIQKIPVESHAACPDKLFKWLESVKI